jgi:hypothetical protein
MGSLALVAALQGNSVGSAAWGSAFIFAGGLASLYTFHQRRLAALLLAASFILSALPFSLTATGWSAGPPVAWFMWIPLVTVEALMLAGYLSSVLRQGDSSSENPPSWAQVTYPTGLLLLALSGLVLGFVGWAGAGEIGVLPAAMVATLLGTGLGWFFWRIPGLQRVIRPVVESGRRLAGRPASTFDTLAAAIWTAYRFLRRIAGLLAAALEGEGGLLWTLVLLVLLASIFQVALR